MAQSETLIAVMSVGNLRFGLPKQLSRVFLHSQALSYSKLRAMPSTTPSFTGGSPSSLNWILFVPIPASRNSKMSFSFLRSPGQTMHLALSSRFRDGH